MSAKHLQPQGWATPKGYSNGVAVRGHQIFLAGQVGWDARQQFASDELASQVRQTLQNILALLAEAGARPEHLVRLTWFITSRDEYQAQRRDIGAAYREVLGHHFPPMSVVEVSALMEARAKVEIEATAVVPDED